MECESGILGIERVWKYGLGVSDTMPEEHKATVIDLLREEGPFVYVHILAFVIGLAIAIWITMSRKGMRARIAFVPVALLPFFVGMAVLAEHFSHDIEQTAAYAAIIDARVVMHQFHPPLRTLFLASTETAILLAVAGLLLASKHARFSEGPPRGDDQ